MLKLNNYGTPVFKQKEYFLILIKINCEYITHLKFI